MLANPLFKLEHQAVDEQKAKDERPQIDALIGLQERGRDDFDNNQLMRRLFKKRKMEEEAVEAEKNKVKNFGLALSDLTERDVSEIQHLKLNANSLKLNHKLSREKILTGSCLTKNVHTLHP